MSSSPDMPSFEPETSLPSGVNSWQLLTFIEPNPVIQGTIPPELEVVLENGVFDSTEHTTGMSREDVVESLSNYTDEIRLLTNDDAVIGFVWRERVPQIDTYNWLGVVNDEADLKDLSGLLFVLNQANTFGGGLQTETVFPETRLPLGESTDMDSLLETKTRGVLLGPDEVEHIIDTKLVNKIDIKEKPVYTDHMRQLMYQAAMDGRMGAVLGEDGRLLALLWDRDTQVMRIVTPEYVDETVADKRGDLVRYFANQSIKGDA